MRYSTSLALAVLLLTSAVPALSQSPSPSAQELDGAYRGTIVCEKIKVAPGILRAPFDMIVRGGNVQFARPTFNLKGTRVTGSELGSGTIEPGGKLRLASSWVFGNFGFQSDYTGALTGSGGTLTGTQSWHGPDQNGSRACNVAFVPAPKPANAQP